MNDSLDLFSASGQPAPGSPGGGSIGKVIIEADGGSRGNPGVAGSGSVLYSADRSQVLRKIAYVVGTATNNVAEYHALLNGLRAAYEMGARDVEVLMDSKLVVEQMSGRWKIKHPDMRELAVKCQAIARNFASISYNWVPRKDNTAADELANTAMDALAKGAPIGILNLGDPASASANSKAFDPQTDAEETPDVAPSQEGDSDQHNATGPTTWNGATTTPTRLVLLRHGQTEMSRAKQYSGNSDPELTPLGERQARAAASHISNTMGDIDVVVASPLRRCQQTAKYVANLLGKEVETIDGLREMNFGDWEGKTFAEAQKSDPELHSNWLEDTSVATPNGESLDLAHERVSSTLRELTRRYTGKSVLVVSHVTPIKAVVREAVAGPADIVHRLHLDLASISVAEFYEDGPSCLCLFNDTSFLQSTTE